jgi:hypothetical protein
VSSSLLPLDPSIQSFSFFQGLGFAFVHLLESSDSLPVSRERFLFSHFRSEVFLVGVSKS